MKKVARTDSSALIKLIERECATAGQDTIHLRRLEAVLLLLRGMAATEVSTLSGFSVRSIQRWARAVSHDGPRALDAMPQHGRRSRLSVIQLKRLRADLMLAPSRWGYAQDTWTGSTLSWHLRQHHKVEMGERHCRELIRQFVPLRRNRSAQRKNSIVHRARANVFAANATLAEPSVFSDHELKRRALHKIQRLAGSGLPLQPFAFTLFDIVSEAIPQLDIHALNLWNAARRMFFLKNIDPGHWMMNFDQFSMWPERFVHGLITTTEMINRPRSVLYPDEMMEPGFYKSAAFNEFFSPLGIERSLMTVLKDEGEPIGFLPLHRPFSMKPFAQGDVRFMEAAAPHIAHGLKAALISPNASPGNGFEGTAGSKQGVVLMEPNGHVIALDASARAIFHQIGVFDALPADAFAASQVKSSLEYVAKILGSIFFEKGEPSFDLNSPVARVYSHHTGITLKLRGLLVNGDPAHRYFTVLVEQGETEEHRRKRLMYRWGLSPREVELLDLVAARYRPTEIAARMGITTETARTYLKRLTEKLDLTGRKALVSFASGLKSAAPVADPES